MAFQPVPNVAQIRVEGRVDGQLTINDLYFEISGGGITVVNLGNLTGLVGNWVTAFLTPLLSENWTCTRVTGLDLTTATGPTAEVAVAAEGEVVAEAVPNNVAACVSFRSGLAGRSFRGRNYVPAIPNNQVNLNTIDPSLVTALCDAYANMIGAGTFAPGWQWGVVSRRTAGALRPTGIISPIVAAVMTTPYVRSMRSREIGHGA